MNYTLRVKARTEKSGNIVCMGLDPVLNRIPLKGLSPEDAVEKFYLEILNEMARRKVFPAAVKPNIAFYESISINALKVLERLINAYQQEDILVILDAKMGDIGKTSAAYAKTAFEVFKADAVTVNPYMGYDSIRPFQEAAIGQGIYVLVRTSNTSASDFQEIAVGNSGKRLFELAAEKLSQWTDGSLGAVVGATAPREMESLLRLWKAAGPEIPCLIPGVAVKGVTGGQGGTIQDVLKAIDNAGSNRNLHLINSSSGLNYAWEKFPGMPFAAAATAALEEMIEEQNRAEQS